MIISFCFSFFFFQKEVVLDKLNSFPWHLMIPKHQKMIAHMMNRLQNGAEIRMGPLDQLNYDIFARVRFKHVA